MNHLVQEFGPMGLKGRKGKSMGLVVNRIMIIVILFGKSPNNLIPNYPPKISPFYLLYSGEN